MVARIALLFAVLALCFVPASAQEPLGPGEGKPIVYPEPLPDLDTLNPLLAGDGSSGAVIGLLYPALIGIDPDTGEYMPRARGSLATGWSFSEDGKTLTISLRDDWVWSDETPITSADVQYAYDAVTSGQMDSPLLPGLAPVKSLTSPDDHTVVVEFHEADCVALSVVTALPVVPAHHFREMFPTFADITAEGPENLSPQVTAGPFMFGSYRAGEQVTLLANQRFPDSTAGHVVPEGVVIRLGMDVLVAYEQFLNGQLTIVTPSRELRGEAQERAADGEFGIYSGAASGYSVLFFNLGDPANPQPGFDENGVRVAQGPHPILGQLNVRKAIAHAVNFEEINTAAYSGTELPVGGMILPSSWAYNAEIQPYPFDRALSRRLLDEAGWVDHDNDAETPRIATEAVGTVEPGTSLELTLMTFSANEYWITAATLLQGQLKQVGIGLRVDPLDFNLMVDLLVGQTHDIVLVHFDFVHSLPHQMADLIGTAADIPGAAFNTMSYANPTVDELLAEARVVPGCDQAERKALYDQVQQIVYDDLPFYLLNTTTDFYVLYQNNLENFDPKPFSYAWNLPAWSTR